MFIKKIIPVFILITYFLFPVGKVNAQVLINEFGSASSDDWVELYSNSDVDISDWILDDEGTSTNIYKFPSGTWIGPSTLAIRLVDSDKVGNRLNNSGDTIYLYKSDGTTISDSITYGGVGFVCLPGVSESIGRLPYDGGNTIDRISNPSKNSSNNYSTLNSCPVLSSTPTPTSTLTPIPTQTSTPTSTTSKGYYKINEAKDSSGAVLSQVKIYIDGTYIHHYAPETLTFCDSCKCDEASCGFGNHTFKLEKSGYSDWSETKMISTNTNIESSPVMTLSVSTASTATVTPKPSVKPTAIFTPTMGINETGSNQEPLAEMVLGYQDMQNVNNLSPTPIDKDNSTSTNFPYTAILFIVGGLVLVAGSIFSFVRINGNGNKIDAE